MLTSNQLSLPGGHYASRHVQVFFLASGHAQLSTTSVTVSAGCPIGTVFDAKWMQVEATSLPVPLIRVAEQIDTLTAHEANLPTDAIRPALSPAQWSARQAAACKVLFTLYWLRQHPQAAKQAGESLSAWL